MSVGSLNWPMPKIFNSRSNRKSYAALALNYLINLFVRIKTAFHSIRRRHIKTVAVNVNCLFIVLWTLNANRNICVGTQLVVNHLESMSESIANRVENGF